jgi:hypothetical protein
VALTLTAADWPEVREALDVSLDEAALPADTIARPIFAGRAESWINARLPAYDGLSAADKAHARTAAVLYLAAILAPRIPDLTGETLAGTGSYSREKMDWSARSTELAGEAERELALVAILAGTALPVSTFRRAPGGRGR